MAWKGIINHTIDEDGRVYREDEYFVESDKKYIKAIIIFKSINEEFKKVFDALKIVEAKYKDKIAIKIQLARKKDMKLKDLHVVFHNQTIYENCHKLDNYINIVENILNKKKRGNKNDTNS